MTKGQNSRRNSAIAVEVEKGKSYYWCAFMWLFLLDNQKISHFVMVKSIKELTLTQL
jgi:hypothetical protein